MTSYFVTPSPLSAFSHNLSYYLCFSKTPSSADVINGSPLGSLGWLEDGNFDSSSGSSSKERASEREPPK